MAFAMDNKSGALRITQSVQGQRAIKQGVFGARNIYTGQGDVALQARVNDGMLTRLHMERRQGIDKDGTTKQRWILRRHFGMVDEKAGSQGTAMREAQHAVEGPVERNGLVEQVIRVKHIRFVAILGRKSPREAIVAVVRPVVVARNARPRARVDLAL